MLPFVLLSFFLQLVLSAIIDTSGTASPLASSSSLNPGRVSTLTQNYDYELTVSPRAGNQSSDVTVFVTFAITTDPCEGYACYIGWVNNYTIDGQVYQGFNSFKKEGNPLFLITAFQEGTYNLTLNTSLEQPLRNLVELCAGLLNPFFPQISNLNPFNSNLSSLLLYTFTSLNFTGQGEVPAVLEDFEVQDEWLKESYWVGWNQTELEEGIVREVIVIDPGQNNIVERRVQKQGKDEHSSINYLLSLKKKSLFSDLTLIHKQLNLLTTRSENQLSFIMQPSTIQPALMNLYVPPQ